MIYANPLIYKSSQAIKVISVFPNISEAVDKGWRDSLMYEYNMLFLEILS